MAPKNSASPALLFKQKQPHSHLPRHQHLPVATAATSLATPTPQHVAWSGALVPGAATRHRPGAHGPLRRLTPYRHAWNFDEFDGFFNWSFDWLLYIIQNGNQMMMGLESLWKVVGFDWCFTLRRKLLVAIHDFKMIKQIITVTCFHPHDSGPNYTQQGGHPKNHAVFAQVATVDSPTF